MQKLKETITGKERWSGLESYILLVESNKELNPNASLDGAKGILESVSKTILEDKGITYAPDSNVGFLNIPLAVSHALNMKDEVYIFDTYQELFRWLAED